MFTNDLKNIFSYTLHPADILANLTIALFCGLAISMFYRWTYRGPNYSRSFVNSLVILSLITSIVILVIGNNLARAFGLVGAMSIIRFRTPIKDAHDIVFIFFSLTVGLAAGVGLYKVAVIGTIFVGLVLIILHLVNFADTGKKEFLLQFSIHSNIADPPPYLETMNNFCRDSRLINVRSVGAEDRLELSYYIRLKDDKSGSRFVNKLKTIKSIEQVNLFFDDDGEK